MDPLGDNTSRNEVQDDRVPGDQNQSGAGGLSDQHAIKRIAVTPSQRRCIDCVIDSYAAEPNALIRQSPEQPSNVDGKLALRRLDREFPRRRGGRPDIVARTPASLPFDDALSRPSGARAPEAFTGTRDGEVILPATAAKVPPDATDVSFMRTMPGEGQPVGHCGIQATASLSAHSRFFRQERVWIPPARPSLGRG